MSQIFNVFPTTIYAERVENHPVYKELYYDLYAKYDYEENERSDVVSEGQKDVHPLLHLEPTLHPLFGEIISHVKKYVLDILEGNPALSIADIIATLDNYFCWVYNLRLKRWDLWEVPPNAKPLSIVADKNGDIVMATNGGLFKYATDENNKRKWEWVSKQITLGEDNKSKKYYKVKTHSNTDEEFLQYSIDKGEFIEGLNINKKAKSLQIKIDSEDPNLEVDSISIPYRNLPNSKQNI